MNRMEHTLLGVGTAISDARAAVKASEAEASNFTKSTRAEREVMQLRSSLRATHQAIEGIYEAVLALLATDETSPVAPAGGNPASSNGPANTGGRGGPHQPSPEPSTTLLRPHCYDCGYEDDATFTHRQLDTADFRCPKCGSRRIMFEPDEAARSEGG